MSKKIKIVNILFNLSAGMLPKNLSREEVKVLEDHFGSEWFSEMGYKEDIHDKPTFEDEQDV